MLWKWLCMLQNGNAARKSIWKTKNVSKSKIGARTSRFCIEMSMCWNQSSYSNSQHHCWGTWPENAGQNMSVAWVDEKRLHNDLIFQHIKTIKYFSFSCHILETNWMKCNKRSTFYTLSPSDPMMENHFSFYRSLLFLNSRECMVYYVVQIEQRKYFSLFVPPTHTQKRINVWRVQFLMRRNAQSNLLNRLLVEKCSGIGKYGNFLTTQFPYIEMQCERMGENE